MRQGPSSEASVASYFIIQLATSCTCGLALKEKSRLKDFSGKKKVKFKSLKKLNEIHTLQKTVLLQRHTSMHFIVLLVNLIVSRKAS